VTTDDGYLLANRQAEAAHRFDTFAELFDPASFRRLAALGLGSGWRVWEIGAGSLHVPRWLAEQVGPAGQVLTTDIDTRWLADPPAGVEVRRHDVAAEPPPAGPFDLVHARLVLVHLPDRQRALNSMLAALRPGGWLLVEDADPALQPLACPDEAGEPERLANLVRRGFRQLLAERGADLAYGRTLPRLLRSAGLVSVAAEGQFPYGGQASRELEAATVRQLRDQLLAAGLVTEAQLDEHLANLAAGELELATAPMIAAWGRKPA